MPSVYTIEGTRRPRKGGKKSGKRARQQNKFSKAAKYCSRQAKDKGMDFRECMRAELGNR